MAALIFVLPSCGEDTTSNDSAGGQVEAVAIGDGKGGGAELFAAMVAAQEEASSYKFEMQMAIEDVQVDASGAAQYGASTDDVDMTMTMSMPLDDLGTGASNGEFAMLVVDGQIYMRFPPEAGLPAETPWLTIDPGGDDPLSQAFGAMSEQLSDSAAIQRQFAEHADLFTVEELGPDSASGVDVTKYRVTLNAEDLGEFSDIPGAEGLSTEDAPFDELSYTLWLDADSLPRRIDAAFDGTDFMEMRFFGFGEPVEVEAPTADQVTDFARILGDL